MNLIKDNIINIFDIRNEKQENKKNIIISKDYNNKPVSFYSDNIWDFRDLLINNNSNCQRRFVFTNKIFKDGTPIVENDFYLNIYKDAIYYLIISKFKIQTLNKYFNFFFIFLDYCYTYFKNKEIKELTEQEINSFILYLNTEKNDMKQKENCLTCVKKTIFLPNHNFSFSINFEPFKDVKLKSLNNIFEKQKTQQTHIIPDNDWIKIINQCENLINEFNYNIKIENKLLEVIQDSLDNNAIHRFNLYFKKRLKSDIAQYKNANNYYDYIYDIQIACAMIIQAFTGMRMSELQSIKKNCIKEEEVIYNNKKYNIFKIEGLTFKYQRNIKNNENYGKLTNWLCPEIVVNAVKTLELATRIPRYKIENKIKKLQELSIDTNNLLNSKDLLFVSNHIPIVNSILGKYKISTVNYSQKNYDDFIKRYNINLDFKLHSHCFRRTFARFISRSLIDIEIEAIKEQFKHFSKDITIYYMREDKQLESNFAELMEEYNHLDENNKNKNLLFEKIKKTIDNSILTANNLEELLLLTNGKQLKIVNEFVASINDETKTFSPIDCLTCDGNVIIPKIHLEYWLDMLSTYNELVEIEPNSIWYKKERDMVNSVVNTLKNNKFYITGVNK